MPFLEAQLATRTAPGACWTAAHRRSAIALARAGYSLGGGRLSAGMVARARQNAAEADVALDSAVAGFWRPCAGPAGPFDAVLCWQLSAPRSG